MKQLLCSALFLFTLSSAVQAQNKVFLELAPYLGTEPFEMNVPIPAGSYEYKITRLEYYISEIKIAHDGGQITPMTDVFLLVRPAAETVYELGDFPNITAVENITFSIGIDSAHNHLDPTTYTDKHPLAPQDPSMHWGWVSGYRFIAIEGKAGTNFTEDFEIHALGDNNYKTLTINTPAENQPGGDKIIRLKADYAQVLAGVDVSFGTIVHSSSHSKAIKTLNNMKNLVFSAATSATLSPAFEGTFVLAPNPAPTGRSRASMALPAGFEYRISVTDLTGRVVLNQAIAPSTASFVFENQLNTGAYLVHLWQNEQPVVVEKLIVVR